MMRLTNLSRSYRSRLLVVKRSLTALSHKTLSIHGKALHSSHDHDTTDTFGKHYSTMSEGRPTTAFQKSEGQKSPNIASVDFWSSRESWARSGINTLRCLVGCTSGDFAMMWYLQFAYPDLNTVLTMSLAMAAGITNSIILETTLLHCGKDSLPWTDAAKTATGMSMISMLAMEVTENVVDYTLTGGSVDLQSSFFWTAVALSMTAGFFVPLPYNYIRLRANNKSCH